MSHIIENEDVVLAESGNVPPPAKKTKEAGGSRPTKAKEPSKKKAKAKAKKVKEMTCVKTCQPGPRSGCTIQQHYYGHIMGHNW